jgi:hypothetical protein
MSCFKGGEAPLGYDPVGGVHEANAIRRDPLADAELMREVGGYKPVTESSGQRCSVSANCGVTSAVYARSTGL